jgi:GDP-L-fucose synthase
MKKIISLFILLSLNLFALDMPKNAKIYLAGHTGLVGSTIHQKLIQEGYSNVVIKSFKELDLRNQKAVQEFFENEKPEYVIIAAAKVGGIYANQTSPADFLYDNLMIASNIIHNSYLSHVKKLLFLGSSCIYPRNCPQPIKEDYLLTGSLEKTNEAYALAKISALKMCAYYNEQYGTNFISCMPTNLYGPNDHFDLKNSHVIPALIAKFYQAKKDNLPQVEIWGTGQALREFLYVEDLADACLFLMNHYNRSETVNIGTGQDISIKDLAYLIKDIIHYSGEIVFNSNMPDGTPKKLLDVSKITSLGWKSSTSLEEGLKKTIKWYQNNQEEKIN